MRGRVSVSLSIDTRAARQPSSKESEAVFKTEVKPGSVMWGFGRC